jgi:hypothetical protein
MQEAMEDLRETWTPSEALDKSLLQRLFFATSMAFYRLHDRSVELETRFPYYSLP